MSIVIARNNFAPMSQPRFAIAQMKKKLISDAL